MAKVEYNGKTGVWRTVGGRRIFIADGEDLVTAMKNSGKFKGLTEKGMEVVAENGEDFKKAGEDLKSLIKENEEKQEYSEKVKEENKLSDKEIKQIKTQKSLKKLVEDGKAKDITRLDNDETRKLDEEHGRLERVQVIMGTYGMNGALLQSNKTGEYFVITARNSNLFYWV